MVLEIIELFILGIGVGTFGSLVGLGGGLIMVPLFTLLMMPPHGSTFQTVQQVVGTSLFGVFLNSISGTVAYIRQKRVFFRAAIPFAIATIPGAFLGSYISDWFTGPGFLLSYGVCTMLLGFFMYYKSKAKAANRAAAEFTAADLNNRKIALGIAFSFFVGFYSSVMGVGGGVIHVPMMVFLLGFPPQIAAATSTFVLAVSSFIGTISHAMLDHIIWIPAISVGCGCIVGAQIGAAISKRSRPKIIVIIISFAMVAIGLEFIWKGWVA